MRSIISIVISSCIILAGYFLLARNKRKQAIRDVQELTRGVMDFYKKYNQFPIVSSKEDEQNFEITTVLAGTNWTTGNSVTEKVAQLNPESINFIEYFRGRKTVNGMITDPWNQPYHIALDTNDDGITEISTEPGGKETILRIEAPLAIWSNGPNRQNDLGSKDEIASWLIFVRPDTSK